MSDLITAQTPTADHVRLALSLMADGAHMVLSGVPDDPSLTIYSFPGHVSKALHAQLADAQAAVALVVERAATVAAVEVSAHGEAHLATFVRRAIRALADTDGLALVRELRAERDEANRLDVVEMQMRHLEMLAADELMRKHQGRAELARVKAERDCLAAENASLKAREKVDANLLLAAYKGLLVLHRMLSKSGLSVGAETATYITDQIAAAHPEMPGLASLRAAPTDPGDGWTWNERLGWIGPDGKPADPRRRG